MSDQYPNQPGYQMPGGPPAPQKKKKAGKIAGFGCLGVVAIIAIIAIASSGGGNDKQAGPTTADKPTSAKNDASDDKPAAPAEEDKPSGPKTEEYPDGDYVVGEDIPAGMYTSEGAKKSLFEFCSITTKPGDSATLPQLKTANADQRIIITLNKSDGVVTVSGCEPLTPRK